MTLRENRNGVYRRASDLANEKKSLRRCTGAEWQAPKSQLWAKFSDGFAGASKVREFHFRILS